MKQDSMVRLSSEDKKIMVLCETGVGLGELHDFLYKLKGEVLATLNKKQEEASKVEPSKEKKPAEEKPVEETK